MVKYLRKKLIKALILILEEASSGTIEDLEKCIAKFCLQEGLRKKTAQKHVTYLQEEGLLKFISPTLWQFEGIK